jgi:hypothetical protein
MRPSYLPESWFGVKGKDLGLVAGERVVSSGSEAGTAESCG